MHVLGTRLQELRSRNAMSQGQVAEYARVAQSSYSELERGVIQPKTIAAIVNLARFFEVSTDYLLGVTNDPTPHGRDETPPPFALEMTDVLRRLGPLQSERLLVMAEAFAEREERRLRAYGERAALLDELEEYVGRANALELNEFLSTAVTSGDTRPILGAVARIFAEQRQHPPQDK